MSNNSFQDGIETGVCAPQRVSISRWVNEPYPAWDRILTAHDVARLIRRPPWLLGSMAAVGQFPKRQRFRGKNLGWLRADILDWMGSRHLPVQGCGNRQIKPTAVGVTDPIQSPNLGVGSQAVPASEFYPTHMVLSKAAASLLTCFSRHRICIASLVTSGLVHKSVGCGRTAGGLL